MASLESTKNYFKKLKEYSPGNIMLPVVIGIISGLILIKDRL